MGAISHSEAEPMTIIHLWRSLTQTFEIRASEWTSAGATVTAGLIGLLNPEYMTGLSFRTLTSIASADTWTWLFLLVGISRWIVLLVNGMYWRTPHFRAAFAFLTCFVWFALLLGFAPNMSLGLALFPWLFLQDAINTLRAGKEAGIAQFLHHHKNGLKKHERTAPQLER